MTDGGIMKLDSQQLTEVLECTEIEHTLDLGIAYVHRGNHAVHGNVTIFAGCTDRHAMVVHKN